MKRAVMKMTGGRVHRRKPLSVESDGIFFEPKRPLPRMRQPHRIGHPVSSGASSRNDMVRKCPALEATGLTGRPGRSRHSFKPMPRYSVPLDRVVEAADSRLAKSTFSRPWSARQSCRLRSDAPTSQRGDRGYLDIAQHTRPRLPDPWIQENGES